MARKIRLCILARADETGLGVQSRNWVRLLNPSKIIVINSKPFNGNKQHYEWYKKPNAYRIDGFIKDAEIKSILKNVDVLLTFEIPYNYKLISAAREIGVKTIIQNNWEFTDYLMYNNLPLPDLLVNHSYWNIERQMKLFPKITDYCPTPLFIEDFDKNYDHNLNRKSKMRFLHIAGRKTYEDRNGTQDLIRAIKLIPKNLDFELVIKTQTVEVDNINDQRIIVDSNSPADEKELYYDFDCAIMPRRYAGACLPMNESLASGLPVIMTDIDPNNKVLPKEWLVRSEKKNSFVARTVIEVYSANHQELANKIQSFIKLNDITKYKKQARAIAEKEYSSESVKAKWDLLLARIGYN